MYSSWVKLLKSILLFNVINSKVEIKMWFVLINYKCIKKIKDFYLKVDEKEHIQKVRWITWF